MTTPVSLLTERLAAEIRSGKLPPGTALPTHRQLAARHGMAVASASKVYARLQAMGLAIGETGRGTFVRDRPPHGDWDRRDEARLSRDAADLSFNHPVWPGQAELMRAMLRDLAVSGDIATLMHQQPPGGRRHERQVVADFLARERGVPANAKVFLVNGAQQGLDIAARALLSPGDAVAVDALTYPGFKMLAELQRLTLQPVPISPEGPDLDALDALCRRQRIRAIYTMPTLHNPLGWVLTPTQRNQLVAIARRHGCLLIEDASYAFLVRAAAPPLAALAPERTAYVSSVSKSLASGLRFGFMAVPEVHAGKIKAAIRGSSWGLPSVITAMATRWIADGTVARQEQLMRREARRRQTIARKALAELDVLAHPSSLFLWLRLPHELRMDRIAMALAERGIAVSKAEAYATTRHAPHALRLGLSSLSAERLTSVLEQVRQTIERFPG
ncbi:MULTISPECIES: aminotransferase-like domain-containing protein [Pseudomonadota]|jgi:DNA-binding transcriptional MocR family regulator|uniref:aminotransferase-like domain-containing protein n=1 Tax=Pseudomonadota TaxID=1224 RepID=UPI001B775407|nr:PLP-dependent aminotransferase family protein [Achromobacter xylosoxidans]MBP7654971.1 PLP-dependent aminotransferase family protein [Pseudoxanthomonas sp.]MCH4578148.1 PLP-dependent aminotransferase family protein [Achromobacter xylosoxidans]